MLRLLEAAMLSSKLKRAQRSLDKQLAAHRPAVPASGWLRAVREATGMTGPQLGARLSVTRQSVEDLEKSEMAGTITLNSLRRAAAALDCRLVYAIVPDDDSFEALVEKQATRIAREALARSGQTMLLEDQSSDSRDGAQMIKDYINDHLRDGDLWAR